MRVPFALGGSGSLFIYGLVDATYTKDTLVNDMEATKEFVKKSVAHAMARDGSSGGAIRTMVVTENGNSREYSAGDALPFGPTGY